MNLNPSAHSAYEPMPTDILTRIETIALYGVRTLQRTLRLALLHQPVDVPPYDFETMRAQLGSPTVRLTIYDLEGTLMAWRALIPEAPEARAALLQAIGQKYRLSRQAAPNLCQLFGADHPDVRTAYQRLTGEDFNALLASPAPADDRPFWFRLQGITDPAAVNDLQTELDWLYLPSGEVLYREGEPGDSMCVIVTGRMRVSVQGPDGEDVLVELGRGAVVGELAALSHERRRTATVYAIRDSELIRITGTGLQRLSSKHPQIGFAIMQEVVAKLRRNLVSPRASSQPSTIAVIPHNPGVPLRKFTQALTQSLNQHAPAFLLDSATFDAALGPGASQLPESDSRNGDLIVWLTALEMANRFVVLEPDTELTEWTMRCLRTADRIMILAWSSDSPEIGPLEQQIQARLGDTLVASRDLILLQPKRRHLPTGTRAWLEHRQILRHAHVCLETRRDVEKLARFLAGKALGLVLGGGGARGLAHVGLVRALEEANITVDAIGGTSFGAIIGGGLASEWDAQKLYERTRDFALRARSYFNYTLPMISFMDGNRLNRFFDEFFDRDTIEDLWQEFFCVASNMSVGREVIFDQGSLRRSVRASMSIPGVFPPVQHEGNLLVDGGLLNNLPVHLMRARIGNGTIIASHIRIEDTSPTIYTYDDHISPWQMLGSRLNPLRGTVHAPSIFDTITRSIGLSNRWTIPAQKAAADLLIEHSVNQFGLFQWEAVDDIVDVGYRTAKQAIAAWQAETNVTT